MAHYEWESPKMDGGIVAARHTIGDYQIDIETNSATPELATELMITLVNTTTGETAIATKELFLGSRIVSWSVEANETTTDVYINLKAKPLFAGEGITVPPPKAVVATVTRSGTASPGTFTYWVDGDGFVTQYTKNVSSSGFYCMQLFASAIPGLYSASKRPDGTSDGSYALDNSFTYAGKTVYWGLDGTPGYAGGLVSADPVCGNNATPNNEAIAWMMVYGVPGETSDTVLAARFGTDPVEAGATGQDSFWIDPLDWNIDPTTVLNLEVDGALSGRHNDPLNENADYSYTPSDQNKNARYGCGGHGGHGGGGGAGASTIVVKKFATDKANSKNIVTKPKRHGYGSGGGKGGEGGDGCILIYY